MLTLLTRYPSLSFWIPIGLFGLSALINIPKIPNAEVQAKNAEQQARKLAERQRFCDETRRSSLVQDMKKTGAIHSMRWEPGFVVVEVTDVWMALPFQEKRKLDNMLQCYGARAEGSVLGTYNDYRTGKSIATMGGTYGFHMK
ncbi:MAG: hypothetical protein QM706_09525 [Nitrospira sp.]